MQVSRQSYHINNVTIAARIISKNRDLRRIDEAGFNLKLLSAILKRFWDKTSLILSSCSDFNARRILW